MKRRTLGRNSVITDRLWYDVYHPLEKDPAGRPISQGQVCVSFELMPKSDSEKKPNGLGRDAPNVFTFIKPLGLPHSTRSHGATFLQPRQPFGVHQRHYRP